jgi:hypothetical protein
MWGKYDGYWAGIPVFALRIRARLSHALCFVSKNAREYVSQLDVNDDKFQGIKFSGRVVEVM